MSPKCTRRALQSSPNTSARRERMLHPERPGDWQQRRAGVGPLCPATARRFRSWQPWRTWNHAGRDPRVSWAPSSFGTRGSGPAGRPWCWRPAPGAAPGEIWVPGQRASCRKRAGRRLWGSHLSAGQGGAKRRCRAGPHRHPDVAAAPRKRGHWGARLPLAGGRLLRGQQRTRRPRPASRTLRPAGSVVLSPASHRRGLGCAGGHRRMHIPPAG